VLNDPDWFYHNLSNNIPFGFSRFNDGEMMGIAQVGSTVARGDQVVNKELSMALKTALCHKQENYYVGLPCSICYPQFNKLATQIADNSDFLTSAVVLTNRNWKHFIDTFPKAIKDRRLLWIGGDDQDVDNLEELGLTVAKKGLIPRKDSWRYYKHIFETFPKIFEPNDVVCISLGPTARVLTQQWFHKMPDITFIDVGSNFDPFTRNVWHDCHKGWEETGFNLTKRCEECN
tara:strand:- start:2033 stop:2728 length:696 start_codon:yes stop_codon:yes gene_type:complete